MARKVDAISTLINAKYFSWIRESILQHGNINIQALSDKFNILAGNTYFRNFIKDKQQDYLGISGLSSILTTCGYKLKLVPVKISDTTTEGILEDITKQSFNDVRERVSKMAETVKRKPKAVKKGPKTIPNTSLLNDSIMGAIDPDDISLFDDDEIEIGYGDFDDIEIE